MTYRWEPTTPLDRILETGFKRMDEAVEGVIDRLAPTLNAEYLGIPYDEAQKIMNYSFSRLAEEMALAAPTIWPTERDLLFNASAKGRLISGDELNAAWGGK